MPTRLIIAVAAALLLAFGASAGTHWGSLDRGRDRDRSGDRVWQVCVDDEYRNSRHGSFHRWHSFGHTDWSDRLNPRDWDRWRSSRRAHSGHGHDSRQGRNPFGRLGGWFDSESARRYDLEVCGTGPHHRRDRHGERPDDARPNPVTGVPTPGAAFAGLTMMGVLLVGRGRPRKA